MARCTGVFFLVVSGIFRVAVLVTLSLCASRARAQSDDSLKHLAPKSIEVTAPKETDIPTIDVRSADIKPVAQLARQTGTMLASDALRAMSSSLDIRRYGSLGGIALPSFRGLPSEYTIVYRDGIRITNEQLGLTDLGQLTLHGVSFVELIPASSAVLLGGDAIGAAINIVSQSVDSASLRIGSEQTSFGSGMGFPAQSYYVTAMAEPVRSLSLIASGSLDQTTGAFPFFQDTAHPSVLRENNDAALRSGSLNALWLPADDMSVRILGNYFYIDRGVPGSALTPGRGAASLIARQSDEQALAGVKIERNDSALHSTLTLSYQNQFESYRDAAYGTLDSSWNALIGANVGLSGPIGKGIMGFAGVEYLRSRLSGTTNVDVLGDSIINRNRLSAYVASKVGLGAGIALAGSLRVEDISSIPSTQVLPQVALDWIPRSDLTLGAAYSRSFHAPTLNDLYWRVLGNRNLVSERGQNWQATIGYSQEWDWAGIQLGVTAFQASIDNEILWLPSANGQDRPINIGHVESRGLELRADCRLPFGRNWFADVQESYTFLEARDKTIASTSFDNELPYTTPTASLCIAQVENAGLGSVAVLIRYRGHKFTNAGNDTSAWLPPVTTIDLTITSREFSWGGIGGRIACGIENLGDVQFYEEANYPMPRRTYKFSIELNYH